MSHPSYKYRTILSLAYAAIVMVGSRPLVGADLFSETPYKVHLLIVSSRAPQLLPQLVSDTKLRVVQRLGQEFGELASVSQLSPDHPLAKRVRISGISDFEIEPADTLDFDKLFLIELDYNRSFIVRSRRVDGRTRQVGDIQSDTTDHPLFVSRAIAYRVLEDFSPVARVVGQPKGDTMKVVIEFQGGKWNDRLTSLLVRGRDPAVPGDYFLKPYWVVRRSNGRTSGSDVPYTLLRISLREIRNGRVTASVESNSNLPWSGQHSKTGDIFALGLRTKTGNLNLRLLDWETGDPLEGCAVSVRQEGFLSGKDVRSRPNGQGHVEFNNKFDHIAYVRVFVLGSLNPVQVPIPITNEETNFQLALPAQEHAAERAEITWTRLYTSHQLGVLSSAYEDHVERINVLMKEEQFAECADSTEELIRLFEAVLGPIEKKLERSIEIEKQYPQINTSNVSWVSDQVAEWKNIAGELNKRKSELLAAAEQRQAREIAVAHVGNAESAIAAGDGNLALEHFQRAYDISQDASIGKTLDRIKSIWDTKDPDQLSARQLIFEKWSNASFESLSRLLPEAKEAHIKLRDRKDFISLTKLVIINAEYLQSLQELTESQAARGETEAFNHYSNLLNEIATWNSQVRADIKAIR